MTSESVTVPAEPIEIGSRWKNRLGEIVTIVVDLAGYIGTASLHGTALIVCRKADGMHYVWEVSMFRRSFVLAARPSPAGQPTDEDILAASQAHYMPIRTIIAGYSTHQFADAEAAPMLAQDICDYFTTALSEERERTIEQCAKKAQGFSGQTSSVIASAIRSLKETAK